MGENSRNETRNSLNYIGPNQKSQEEVIDFIDTFFSSSMAHRRHTHLHNTHTLDIDLKILFLWLLLDFVSHIKSGEFNTQKNSMNACAKKTNFPDLIKVSFRFNCLEILDGSLYAHKYYFC